MKAVFRYVLFSILIFFLQTISSSIYAEELFPGDARQIDGNIVWHNNEPYFDIHTNGQQDILVNINGSILQNTTRADAQGSAVPPPWNLPPYNGALSVINVNLIPANVGLAHVRLNINGAVTARASEGNNPLLTFYSPTLALQGHTTMNLGGRVTGDIQIAYDAINIPNNNVVINLQQGAIIQGNIFTTAEEFLGAYSTPKVGTVNFNHAFTTMGSMKGLHLINVNTNQTINIHHALSASNIVLQNGDVNFHQNAIFQTNNPLINNARLILLGGNLNIPVQGNGSIVVHTGHFTPVANLSGQRIIVQNGNILTLNNPVEITGEQAVQLLGQSTLRINGGRITTDIEGERTATVEIESPFQIEPSKRLQAGNIRINSANGGSLTSHHNSPILGFDSLEFANGSHGTLAGNVTGTNTGIISNRGHLTFTHAAHVTAAELRNYSNLTIQGGVFNAAISNHQQDAHVLITSGTFNRLVENIGGRITLRGGTFNAPFHNQTGHLKLENAHIIAAGGFVNNAEMSLVGNNVIVGSYVQESNGQLVTTIQDSNHYGKLTVTGNAHINDGGTIKVYLAPNCVIAEGETFDLITASNGSYQNANVVLPYNSPYRLKTILEGNILRVESLRSNYLATVADTPHNQVVARALEGERFVNTTPEMTFLLSTLDNAPKEQINNIVSSLVPNNTREVFSAGMVPTKTIVRKSEHRLSLGRSDRELLAMESIGSSGYSAGECCNPHISLGPIIFGNGIRQSNSGNFIGYKAGTQGVGLLADFALSNCVQLGAGLMYSGTQVRSPRSSAKTLINSAEAIVYGGYNWGRLFLDGSIVAGENWYRDKRDLMITRKPIIVHSKHHGFQYSAKVLAGYDLFANICNMILTPLASIEYFHLHQGGFWERGFIDRFTEAGNAHLTQAGAGLRLRFIEDCLRYVPEIHVVYLRDLNEPKLQTTSRFTGGGAAFTLLGPSNRFAKNSINVGGSLTAMVSENVLFTGTYDFEAKKRYRSHSGTLRLRWIF